MDSNIINWMVDLKLKISYNNNFDKVIYELNVEKHICGHIRCNTCNIFLRYDDYCECYNYICIKCNYPCKYENILNEICMDCWSNYF